MNIDTFDIHFKNLICHWFQNPCVASNVLKGDVAKVSEIRKWFVPVYCIGQCFLVYNRAFLFHLTFTCSKSTVKTLEHCVKSVQSDQRGDQSQSDIMTSLYCFFCYLWTDLTHRSGVFIFDFEQVIKSSHSSQTIFFLIQCERMACSNNLYILLTVENQIFIWQKAGHVKEMKIILTFSLPFKMLMYALYYHILCKKVTSEIKYIWYHSEKYPLFTW